MGGFFFADSSSSSLLPGRFFFPRHSGSYIQGIGDVGTCRYQWRSKRIGEGIFLGFARDSYIILMTSASIEVGIRPHLEFRSDLPLLLYIQII